MKHSLGNPILVTGSPRSGSTFVGKMLALPKEIGYVHEPFNRQFGVEGIDESFKFIKAGSVEEPYYERLIRDVLNGKAVFKRAPLYVVNKEKSYMERMRNTIARRLIRSRQHLQYRTAVLSPSSRRYLIKDPIACMSAEWLHQKFHMDVVVLLRHPAAYVNSLKRLNWRFDLNRIKRQELLLEQFAELRHLLNGIDSDRLSIVEEGAIWWAVIHTVLLAYARRNPKMIIVRHEDLSSDPVPGFRKLYEQLHIPFTRKVEDGILKHTSDERVVTQSENKVHVLKRNSKESSERWKNYMSDEELMVIKKYTARIAHDYYPLSDW